MQVKFAYVYVQGLTSGSAIYLQLCLKGFTLLHGRMLMWMEPHIVCQGCLPFRYQEYHSNLVSTAT